MPVQHSQTRNDAAESAPARPPVRRFEDLIAWQKARVLAKDIYHATRSKNFERDDPLARQIQRAAVSIVSYIAEGFERAHPREFHQALATARGSCAEARAQLYIALDIGHLTQEQFDTLMPAALEVGRIIGGLRLSVARKLETAS
ncbi:four helix bundle protein [soil metagenome]